MKKKIILLFVCVFSLLSFNVNAEEAVVLESQLVTKNAEITGIENEIKELENTKTNLKNSIFEINSELKEVQGQLDELNGKIELVTEELNLAQAREDEKKEIFYKRLVVLYEKGNIAYIEAFLESKDIMEITKRTEYIKQISEHDRKIFDEFVSAKKEVDDRKKELDDMSVEYQKQKDEFDSQINQASSEIAAIDEDIRSKNGTLKQLNQEKKDIETKLYKLTYAGRLFAEGEKYLGYPYVWGGSTPETSFDCSGFVCWTYTHSGVYNLPRTTAQQIYNQCKKISPSEARAGDLIFFQNTYYSPHEPVTHVGIYAGDGKMLHCGDPIKYASTQTAYWKSHFFAYGRLEK